LLNWFPPLGGANPSTFCNIGLITKFESIYKNINEQSVLSFDKIPLCDIEEINPIGSKGNLATTIPYYIIISYVNRM